MIAATSEVPWLVAEFAEGWAGPDADRLLALFQPGGRLVQPLFPTTAGRDAAMAGFMHPLLRFLPDLRLTVERWGAAGDTIFIEWTATATLGGRPLRWPGVDRFLVVDGRATERRAYFDALPLVATVLRRPSCWPAFWRSGMIRFWRTMFATPPTSARSGSPGTVAARR